jgi:hypothetical protein
MPKMTRWNSQEPIDVAPEKAAVYAAQGWVSVAKTPGRAPAVTAMTTESVESPVVEVPEAPKPAKKAAQRSPAKKTAKK